MNAQLDKNLLKKLVSMAGVASASVFLALPGLAQVTPSTVQTDQLLAQNTSRNQRSATCGGYEGNGTTGGGYYCALSQQNRQSSNQGRDNTMNRDSNNRGTDSPSRETPQNNSSTDNGGSTTGGGYPGNGVTPQGDSNKMNR